MDAKPLVAIQIMNATVQCKVIVSVVRTVSAQQLFAKKLLVDKINSIVT